MPTIVETARPVAAPPKHGVRRLYAAFAGQLDRLQSLALLAMRLYVGKVFLLSGWLKLTRWDSTLALFANEYHVPVLSPPLAAVMGTAGELGFATLLVLGVGTRAAALGLFFVNAVAVVSYPDLSAAGLKDHILWGTLLVVVALFGPGRYAADRWLDLPLTRDR